MTYAFPHFIVIEMLKYTAPKQYFKDPALIK